MSITKVGYINRYLNNMASASPTGSVEAVTNLPIATGLQVGQYQTFGDGEAALYASKKLVSVQILTAGSGQTDGTYSATASTGGATISYVIASGLLTTVTITNGGTYTVDTAPTFTIAAGGTPATVSATLGFLYNGTYAWCQLDPALTGTTAIKVGQPLYWVATSSSFQVTTTATGNYPNFAGFSIDPAFNPVLPYAFVQIAGKCKALFDATNAAALGAVVNLVTTPGATVTSVASAWTNVSIGTALQIGTTLSPALVLITRAQSRH